MKIVVVDYGSGNLHSVAKAFETTGEKVTVTSDVKEVKTATHLVLPGVGTFADCMKGLSELRGMIDVMEQHVFTRQKPFLGICVGMQLLATRGFENGTHKGLGWIDGEVVRIKPDDSSLKIPHMGWNELKIKKKHSIFLDIKDKDHLYFVHSYHMLCDNDDDVLAVTDYGGDVTAAVGRDNIIGVQFHPEKSQKTGLKLINNFLKI